MSKQESGSLVRRRGGGNFTTIQNEILLDNRISYKAKGIFLYLWSRSTIPDWSYNMADIIDQSKDGKDSVLSGIRELEKFKYVERVPCKKENARFSGYTYLIDDTPSLGELDHGGKSSTDHGGLSATENPPLSKEELNKEDYIVTTEVDDETPVVKESMRQAQAVATFLASKIAESIETYKQPSEASLKSWSKDIEKAIRLDGRTSEQLMDVIKWVHDGQGSFWITNIQSGKKLREKFDTLWFQMKGSVKTVDVKTRALQDFGKGNVFFKYTDDGVSTSVCIYGEYNALYDYNRNKYIDKATAEKLWAYIEKNYDTLLKAVKG